MAKQEKLQTLADELEETIALLEEIEEVSITPLKAKEEELRAEIVKELLKKGLVYIKTTSGKGFGIVAGKKSYEIVKGREHDALEWVRVKYPSVLAIKKADLNKVLKPMLEIPEFFEEKQGEDHLAVRSSTNEQ